MRISSFVVLCIPLLVSPLLAEDWFVSPNGNDAWTGRLAAPSEDKSDGPFASWERAQKAVREKLATGTPGALNVYVRGGVYRRTTALKFGVEDSGRPDAPVVWKGYNEERPQILGSIKLSGWEFWKGEIRRVSLGDINSKLIRQLLLGGKRQPMARYPNADPTDSILKGWAYADGKDWPMYSDIPGEDKRTLLMKEADVRSWSHPEDAEVTVFARFNWWNNIAPVASLDLPSRTIKLTRDCSYPIRFGNRYFVQGPLEELDSTGEWHVDPREKKLYWMPPQGASPEDAEIVVTDSLLIAKQTRHLAFEGIDWEATNAATINFEGAEYCRFAGNTVKNCGEWAGGGIRVTGGNHIEIRSNTVEGAGRDGISVSGGDVPTLARSEHLVENNVIHHFGVFYKQGSGVSISGVGNSVKRNWIYEGPRFGIQHGGNNNLLEGNHIHDVCRETEDTGAIYSGGRDWITPRGTIIRHNYIHDIWGLHLNNGEAKTPYFSWGIYLDDNSSGADVIGNIVARAARGGLHGHGARDCLVQNNIWAGNGQWQVDFHGWTIEQGFWDRHLPTMLAGYEKVVNQPAWKGMRGMEIGPEEAPLPNGLTMRGNRFERNILVSDDANVPVVSILRVPFTHNTFDRNLYWAPGGTVKTGYTGAGSNVGDELISEYAGSPGELPKGWRWSSQKVEGSSAALSEMRADGVALQIKSGGKPTPILLGSEIPLEPGATYRLKARVRANRDVKAAVSMFAYKAKVFNWISPKSEIKVSTDWEEKEWAFVVPLPGEPGGNEEMRSFMPRIELKEADGWLEVAALSLHKATPRTEWESWQSNGTDEHSIVADPMLLDRNTWQLDKESPAWALGFERIPFENIGIYKDHWRSRLP